MVYRGPNIVPRCVPSQLSSSHPFEMHIVSRQAPGLDGVKNVAERRALRRVVAKALPHEIGPCGRVLSTPYWESSRRKRHLDTFTITEVQSRTEDSIHKAYSSK